jgi:hypothetical protein
MRAVVREPARHQFRLAFAELAGGKMPVFMLRVDRSSRYSA